MGSLWKVVIVAIALTLSGCAGGGGGGGDVSGDTGGGPGPDATFAELSAQLDALKDQSLTLPSIHDNDLPTTGTVVYAGVVSYRMFPSPGVTPDYPADFEAIGVLTLTVDFDGALAEGADPISGVATGFVTKAGEQLMGTLTSVAGSSLIDDNRIFPVALTLTGELTEPDDQVRQIELVLSGGMGGDGLQMIYLSAKGEARFNGAPYTELEGAFYTARQ